MDRAESILDAVRRLYDGVLEPDGLANALQPVIEAAGGDAAVLLGADLRTGSADFAIGCGMPSEIAATFAPAYASGGVMKTYRNAVRPDAAFCASAIVPNDTFARSRFYNETVRPTGVFHAAFAISHPAQHHRAILAIGRTLGREDYDAASIATLQLLVPHLTAALRVRQAFGAADLLTRDALTVLDRLDVGVVLVDGEARPKFANRRARNIAANGDALVLSAQGIAAARADETRMLRRAIATMAMVSAPPRGMPDSLLLAAAETTKRLRLSRASSKPPLAALVTPLCDARYNDFWRNPSSSVAVLILEPDSPPEFDAWAFAERYGLAPRETEVALLLTHGLNPKEIASALDIGLGTAREHLKRALAKTGARRQANLVRLVFSEFTLPIRGDTPKDF